MKLTKEILDKVRHIEGFPIGKDEDIIALSDPPHYTACPNPFIDDFIEKHGVPYDEATDDYDIEPYAADVSEGKNDPIYNAHSYHTKVPHKAIMRYILHYTKPGDIVFDGFCGTGMTGVAAQMCGSPDTKFKQQIEAEMGKAEWGARKAILSDLSPAATFIAYNYNTPVDVEEFEKEANRILDEVEKECGWMYETRHVVDGVEQYDLEGKPIMGKINYTVWSDVFICPNCSNELVFWDVAVGDNGKVKDNFTCLSCGVNLKKMNCVRAKESFYDKLLCKVVTRNKQIPLTINYSIGKTRFWKRVDNVDNNTIEKIYSTIDSKIISTYPMMNVGGENWGDIWRSGYHFGVTHSHNFYTERNLFVLSRIWEKSNSKIFNWAFTSVINYLNKKQSYTGGGGGMPGVLYIASLTQEKNVFDVLKRKIKALSRAFANEFRSKKYTFISNQSLCQMQNIRGDAIDYIFIDPPFGSNIMYSEGSFLWEAWHKVFTNNKSEAIINNVQKKGISEYQIIMELCFAENYRILKPNRWMTVVFHNSKNSIWNAIQEAILKAGFVIANVRTLDKQQRSFKQVTTTTAVKQDLVISAYKPKDSFVRQFLLEAGTEEGAWNFIREHLAKLPVIVESKGKLDVIPERENYLLYDGMVAFHIQKGSTIPMGAADFYLGLHQRFPERDGMYFLPNQVNEYDAKRLILDLNEQMSFLVLDEKTAIQWLRNALATPQTYQDLQPKFLQELKQLKHERMPELQDILDENFLRDEEGRWYVPDVNKQSDLEKLREKRLLKDFEEYKLGQGRLREFRTEAIRAGFKHCWREKDYKTIVTVGERLPDSVIQEDSSILMYYDNSQTRIGG